MDKRINDILSKLNKYVNKDETLVVGVSSGMDSMALFFILLNNGYKVVVAHINHKRRIESDTEYEYLKDLCLKLNVPFEGYELNEEINSNFQEVARYKRYEFYKEVCDKYETNKILLAHHADDEAETVLMRLIRGTSLRGYSGIKYISEVDNYKIIRPLLGVSKSDIKKYIDENNIKYFEDSSNSTDHYTRNVVRHNLVNVAKDINPNFLSSVENYKEDMEDSFELIKELSDEFMAKYSEKSNDKIIINRAEFNKLKQIIKKWVLVEAVNLISSDSLILTHERMTEIIGLSLKDVSGKTIELSDSIKVFLEYDKIILKKGNTSSSISLEINDFGDYDLGGGRVLKISQKYHLLPNKNSYMLCYNDIKSVFPIFVKNKESGDKIKVNGITKKVSQILKDNKILKSERDNILVISNKDGIFFIPGIIRKETDTTLENKLYITLIGGNSNDI